MILALHGNDNVRQAVIDEMEIRSNIIMIRYTMKCEELPNVNLLPVLIRRHAREDPRVRWYFIISQHSYSWLGIITCN